jgi:hypothetical protein
MMGSWLAAPAPGGEAFLVALHKVGVVVISGRDFSISPEPQVSEGAGVAAGTSRSRFGHTGK